jgi:serine/threonine-protein kinase
MIPDKIGRYQILGPLGKGTMGAVYRAYDPDTGREMALKELTTPQDPIEAGKWRQRFGREVRAAIRLKHPHIVTVYDVDLEREPPYLVMELLTGDTLKELLLKQKSLPWQTALTLLQPLCQALAYAHRAGVIHRDVKPANVIFAGDEARTIKLVDFGLARWEGGTQVTQAGDVVGTLAYMSPEQAREEVVDARTDIFSLGVILFEAIAGYNPLDKGSFNETWEAVRSYEPIDLEPLEGKAPSHLIKVIQRALEKDRDQRYSTCADLPGSLPGYQGQPSSH